MYDVYVNFANTVGKMKPMHAVNNGPVHKFAEDQRISNLDAFIEAGIPYARNHDASFCSTYGGEHCVDIVALFPNFDADPTDPASYDFELTDELMRVYAAAGVKPFYRLGNKIEHWSKKYGTLPPKDFKKWAVICEHVIRHYNEGWADGMELGIEYWEIWNEADLDPDEATHKRNWGGTAKEFFELYEIAATHLKASFPHLKIGGPALAGNMEWAEEFMKSLKPETPLDFFSWHRYAAVPEKIEKRANEIDELLRRYGRESTESICNEWNYVKGWTGEKWLYSLRREKDIKGAAFIAAVMALSQKGPMDMLMYYDARPCGMNGMFNTDFVCDKLKGYYPFYMFNKLFRLGTAAQCEGGADLYPVAATDGSRGALMFTHFNDDDSTPEKRISVKLEGIIGKKRLQIYQLDKERDLDLIRTLEIDGGAEIAMHLPLFGSILMIIE